MGPCDLTRVLEGLPIKKRKELLVSMETEDDAAIYQITQEMALVQTVDFFTPIVDDPYLFGQIAAANGLSDIYAMGGEPLTAMNIVAFPSKLDLKILQEILRGGRDKVQEAGAVIVGGHTIDDKEPKYGLSVTGLVHPDQIITNAGAKPGDKLVLTKPLGIGILATALKGGEIGEEAMADAIQAAAELNAAAGRAMKAVGVNSCTDITGFGLLGHLHIMLIASGFAAQLKAEAIPIWEEALGFAEMGLVPAGAVENRAYLKGKVSFDSNVDKVVEDVLFDPQTSGGLLISVPQGRCEQLMEALRESGVATRAVIGEIVEGEIGEIKVA